MIQSLISTISLFEKTNSLQVNMDMSQRLDQALQENAALTHHITDLQNQTYALDQQLANVHDAKTKAKQEADSLEKEGKSLQTKVKDSQIKEVELQAQIRKVEEGERIMKDKISTLQRSENKMKHRIQELETSGLHVSAVKNDS